MGEQRYGACQRMDSEMQSDRDYAVLEVCGDTLLAFRGFRVGKHILLSAYMRNNA